MAVTASDLQKLYLAYFGRPADPAGIAFYTAVPGASIWDVAASFGTSAESQALYGTADVATTINNIYNTLFGRDADPAGLLFWTSLVGAKQMTIAGAALNILNGATGTDATAIANKLSVAATFTAHLDTTQEILAYAGNAAAASARTFIKGVTSDATTVTTATNNVDNAIATIVTVGGLPGQNAVLTSSLDNYVGTVQNDTITGVFGSATASQNTLTALDTIDGGLGNDTLVVADIVGGAALPGGITVTNVEKLLINSAGAVGNTTTANFDVSGFSATTINSGNINGAVFLNAGSSQSVNITDTAAAVVTVSGGANQNITTAGGVALSKSAGAITVTDTAGTTASTVDGGTNVAVTIANKAANGSGTYTIGGTTAPTGTVTVSATVTGDKANDKTAGAITVNGGTTVSVSEVGTQAVNTAPAAGATNTNHTLTESAVTVNGGASTTTVTVSQSPTVAVKNTTTASALVAETDTVTFPTLANGASVTLGGLTFTNTSGSTLTAAQTAAAFANLAAGAVTGASTSGYYTGTFSTGFTTGSVNTTAGTVVATGNSKGTATITNTGLTVTSTQAYAAAVKAVAGNGGVTAGAVQILDKTYGTNAGTITNVAVDGWGGTSWVKSDALTTLVLADSDANFSVYNNAASTLGLTVNNLGVNAVGTVSIDAGAAKYTTLNLTTASNDSAVMLTAAAVQALNVAGTNAVDLSGSTLSALKTVTVTGSAGLTVASVASVTDVNASATSGSVTVTNFDATAATYEGGSGTDKLTITGDVSKAISLGAGNDTVTLSKVGVAVTGSIDGGAGTDTLKMDVNDAATASASPTFATKVTNFEALTVTGTEGAARTIDLAMLGNYNTVTDSSTTTGTNTLTLSNMASGGTLKLTGAGTGANDIVNITNASTGTADVLNISISGAGNVTGGSVTAAKVETINIATHDSTSPANPAGTSTDTLTLVATGATSITVTGDANLNLTSTGNTKVTSVDASAMTGGLVYTTAGTTAETVKGGAAANTLTAGAGSTADTLIGGAGNDVLTSNAGLDVLTGGGGTDKFVITAPANVNSYATISDITAGEFVQFAALGTSTFSTTKITLAATAVFQDYANAAINSGGNAGTNAYITWFQYGGDTYIVESRHDATTTHDFQNGTDVIVKLAGLHDLSTATFNTGAAAVGLVQVNG